MDRNAPRDTHPPDGSSVASPEFDPLEALYDAFDALGIGIYAEADRCPVFKHPAESTLRAYQYLRNMGGEAEAGALLRKTLGLRGRLPTGLEEVVRAMFHGSDTFTEVREGYWAIHCAYDYHEALLDGKFVVFDLETTGGKPPTERITEIGAVRVEQGRITDQFQTLVNPEKPIPPFVARLTGITNKTVRKAPKIEKVLPRFLNFIEGYVLIAHDVFQDLRFIDQEIFTTYGGVLAVPVVDTLVLAKEMIDPEIGFSLRKIAEHMEVETGSSHRALDDALVTARVFLRFMETRGRDAWEHLLDGYAHGNTDNGVVRRQH